MPASRVGSQQLAGLGDLQRQRERRLLRAHQRQRAVATETQLSSSLLGSPHRYRIEWGASEIRYYVDGTLVATHAADFGTTQMRPTASDFTPGGPEISVDWVHMSRFAAIGDIRIARVRRRSDRAMGSAQLGRRAPAGTSVTVSVRTGDTATPDQSWSAFSPIASSGNDIPGASRYIQYRAQLSTSDPASTPTLNNVSITYSTATRHHHQLRSLGAHQRLHPDL